jgi:hypothetical protein
LAASESAYQQTSAELQRTRSSLIALWATYSAEIKKKEKEVERVISDMQTKLSTSSSGLTCRCGNADVASGSETLGKGKGYLEIARFVPGYLSQLKVRHKEELALFNGQLDAVRRKMVCDFAILTDILAHHCEA